MVIGEWQWEKFRAFDFLGRFERGRGWEVMGVGEREGVRERARAHDSSLCLRPRVCRSPNICLQVQANRICCEFI